MKILSFTLSLITCVIFSSLAQTNTFPSPGPGNVGISVVTSATHSLTFGSTTTGIAAYNTADQTSAFTRVTQSWQGGNYEIGSFYGTGGVLGNIHIGASSVAGATTLTRFFSVNFPNQNTNPYFEFVGGTNNMFKAGSFLNLANLTFNTMQVGTPAAVAINPTISQGNPSVGFRILWISPYETSTGTGSHYLIDAGTNSAANGSGTHTSVFTIDHTGNGYFSGLVGINTTDNKGYQFAVNGSAIATSMTVKLYGVWPDYVFKPTFVLPALSEIKAYIDKNHHLPEVPSEEQIAKDGLNLGEMNKALLKKVEELTLYLIQMQKQVKEESETNTRLEDRLDKLEEKLNGAVNKNTQSH